MEWIFIQNDNLRTIKWLDKNELSLSFDSTTPFTLSKIIQIAI